MNGYRSFYGIVESSSAKVAKVVIFKIAKRRRIFNLIIQLLIKNAEHKSKYIPDSGPRSVPALELNSWAGSSVGITAPFQLS